MFLMVWTSVTIIYMHRHTFIHDQLYTIGEKTRMFNHVGIKMDFTLANYAGYANSCL